MASSRHRPRCFVSWLVKGASEPREEPDPKLHHETYRMFAPDWPITHKSDSTWLTRRRPASLHQQRGTCSLHRTEPLLGRHQPSHHNDRQSLTETRRNTHNQPTKNIPTRRRDHPKSRHQLPLDRLPLHPPRRRPRLATRSGQDERRLRKLPRHDRRRRLTQPRKWLFSLCPGNKPLQRSQIPRTMDEQSHCLCQTHSPTRSIPHGNLPSNRETNVPFNRVISRRPEPTRMVFTGTSPRTKGSSLWPV